MIGLEVVVREPAVRMRYGPFRMKNVEQLVPRVDHHAAVICERTSCLLGELLARSTVNVANFLVSCKYPLGKVQHIVFDADPLGRIVGHVAVGIVGESGQCLSVRCHTHGSQLVARIPVSDVVHRVPRTVATLQREHIAVQVVRDTELGISGGGFALGTQSRSDQFIRRVICVVVVLFRIVSVIPPNLFDRAVRIVIQRIGE